MENQVARQFLGLERAEWRLWVRWVLITTGLGFLGVFGLVIGSMGGIPYMSALSVLFGLLVGAAQWRLLRKRVHRAGWWMLATAVGWIGGAVVSGASGSLMDSVPFLQAIRAAGYPVALIAVLSGVLIGTAQWLFLRKRVYRAGWWVLATALGWGLGWGLGRLLLALIGTVVNLRGDFFYFFASNALGIGIGAGAITGYVLIVLLRHPISAARELEGEAST